MADLHIDDFYRDVAKIFLQLYSIFPRKTILYVDDISGPDEPDEFGLHHPRFQACFSTMVWLAQHGYLHFDDTIRQEALDQAVLSQKAFLLLSTRSALPTAEEDKAQNAPPSVIAELQSNINQLRKALRDGSSIRIEQCVSYLLSQPSLAH
tara:strand:- start:190070 stop:190522 length:453 start_codon:yes stop_codon:yes gene_type:complete